MMADETPAPLSDAEIAAITERAAKAAPGPWDGRDYLGYGDSIELYESEQIIKRADGEKIAYVGEWVDADFIARARTDIPRLLATLAAFRSAIEDIISAFERAHIEMTHDNWNERVPVDQALTRARALLGTQTPGTTGVTAGEEGE